MEIYQNLERFKYQTRNGKEYSYSIDKDRVITSNPKLTTNFVSHLLENHIWRRDHKILLIKVENYLRNEHPDGVYNTKFVLCNNPNLILTTQYILPCYHRQIDVFYSQEIIPSEN